MNKTKTVCPSCGDSEIEVFHQLENIPVHSAVLVSDREKALSFPCRDLDIGFCSRCGFIHNVIFDSAVQEYGDDYEETQGFSPTFRQFVESLASRLIDDYGMGGKTVLEIGCGKGEFLALLCERGMGKGIGIDPAYVPGRLSGNGATRAEFYKEYYGERHAVLEPDLVCCRHTLEHIGPTRQFLGQLRQNIGSRLETLLFFEVPDTLRILREGAFWDVYYEHCSYFTPGSLARLFRRAGFEVIDLRLEYGGQYVTIVARPAEEESQAGLALEDDLEEIRQGVGQFRESFRRSRERWNLVLDDFTRNGKKIALWGSGSKAVGFLTTLGLSDAVHCVVDVNPHKHGKYMPGVASPIVAPDRLKNDPVDGVIVMNPVYLSEIKDTLAEMGLKPAVMALG